ncbi:hypothetical protein GJAV_G00254650 [Gymnothorax javanicus]|nr:hypothetical protein GJAV_G00254650 [Gymnothorax javanicus]
MSMGAALLNTFDQQNDAGRSPGGRRISGCLQALGSVEWPRTHCEVTRDVVMSLIMWPLLAALTLASSGLCEIPAPVNLNVSSRNYVHLLTWEPGPGSPDGLSYTVQVHAVIETAASVAVLGCEEVRSTFCNLTAAMTDISDTYYIRVLARLANESSSPAWSQAFKPKDHMYLDPPLLSVDACGDSLCVGLSPPSSHLREEYRKLTYVLTIINRKDGTRFNRSAKGLDGQEIKNLEPGRKYCVTARILDRKSDESQPRCVETAVSYSADWYFSTGASVLVAAVVAVVLLLAYSGFICLRATIPETLVSFVSQGVRILPSTYDTVACSPVSVEDTSAAPPVAGGRKLKGNEDGDSQDEDEEVESGVNRGAGYERRPERANQIPCSGGSSIPDPPSAEGSFPPPKLSSYRDVSPTRGDSRDTSGLVMDSRQKLSPPLTRKGPFTESTGPPLPPSESATAHSGPSSLTLTGERLPSAGALQSSSLTAVGLRPSSANSRASPSSRRTEPRMETYSDAPGRLSAAEHLLWGAGDGQEGGCLNVNLGSVLLAGQQGEEAESSEEEEDGPGPGSGYERRPLIFGVTSAPLPAPTLPAAAPDPPPHGNLHCVFGTGGRGGG